MTQHAYSTDNPEAVAVYLAAKANQETWRDRVMAALEALGAGPQVYIRNGMFGDPNRIIALEPKGNHVPEGWRLLKRDGLLHPRRGKPGDPARKWLADHQPQDVRHALVAYGLPRNVWVPRSSNFGYRVVAPDIFEHARVLWARYEAEPGKDDSHSEPCTWTPRKLSEYHAAFEAFQEATAAQEVA
jgi:hypothetical protein